jgi:hypothetical protein
MDGHTDKFMGRPSYLLAAVYCSSSHQAQACAEHEAPVHGIDGPWLENMTQADWPSGTATAPRLGQNWETWNSEKQPSSPHLSLNVFQTYGAWIEVSSTRRPAVHQYGQASAIGGGT